MLELPPVAGRLARAVAREQAALDGEEPGFLVAQRILVRLHEHLGKLIGSVGFDTMLARALVLARRTHPALAGITAGPAGKLEGLAEADAGDVLAIVAHLIQLLMNLIGEDLSMRMIRDIWPAARSEEAR